MPNSFDRDKKPDQQNKSESRNPLAKWLGLGRDRHSESNATETKQSRWLSPDAEAVFQSQVSMGVDGYKLQGRDHFRANRNDVVQAKVWFGESRVVMTAIPAVKQAKDRESGHSPQDAMVSFALGKGKKIHAILDGVSANANYERMPNSGKVASGFLEYLFKKIKPNQTLAEFMNEDIAAGGFAAEVAKDPENFDQGEAAGQVIREVRNADGTHTLEVITFGRYDQFGMMVIIKPNGEMSRLLPESHMVNPALLTEQLRGKAKIKSYTSEPLPPGSILVMCSDGLFDGNQETDFRKKSTFWDEFRAKCMGGKAKLSSDELANLLKNFSRNADDLSLMTVEMFAEQEK